MGKYSIRRCKDFDLINELQKKLIDSGELPKIAIEEREWWVAWENETKKPVGYAAIRPFKDHGWFSICGVLEKHRGNGIQKRLIDARVNFAKKIGLETVYTYTLNRNHPSATSLIRRKFIPCTPPEKHYGAWAGTRDILYWKRDL
jgi:N-acetylglutamate synthase-like GNAT family acetyltransferase